jgi:hypothetical protein
MNTKTNNLDSQASVMTSGDSGDRAAAPQAQVQELVAAPKRRHPLIMLVALLLIVVIAAVTVSWLMNSSGQQSTNDAYVEGRVVRISPKVSGQVISLRVDDNDAVKAGDLLLEIDPVDYQAKLDQAVAAVAAAASAVEQAKAAVLRAEANVGEAQAAARAAATEMMRRASDYRRYLAMGTDGVSAQQVETAKDAVDAANDQKDAAEQKAAAAAAELNVAKTNVGSAEAQVAAAKAQSRGTSPSGTSKAAPSSPRGNRCSRSCELNVGWSRTSRRFSYIECASAKRSRCVSIHIPTCYSAGVYKAFSLGLDLVLNFSRRKTRPAIG